jgi:uncharacterized protein involved in exopolysaccharide biosynthesis
VNCEAFVGYEAGSLVAKVLRRWWAVVLVVIIVMGLAGWQVATSPKRYRATAEMVISPNPGLSPADFQGTLDLLNNRTVSGTIADVIDSPAIVDPIFAELGLPTSGVDGYSVQAVNEPDSNAIRLLVEGPDRGPAIQLSTAVQARAQTVVAQQYPNMILTSLQAGEPKVAVANLSSIRALAIAGIVAVGLGVLVALWLDALFAYRHERRRTAVSSAIPSSLEAPSVLAVENRDPAGRR